ncbi:hypothetical protein B6E66_02045 [Streptomyces maremycinicus]|nr:hypothetical protein B6E66_02045 [Streptomyces sp. B9173]
MRGRRCDGGDAMEVRGRRGDGGGAAEVRRALRRSARADRGRPGREGACGKSARAPEAERPDLLRREEIPTAGVSSVWDAKMLLPGDDRVRGH